MGSEMCIRDSTPASDYEIKVRLSEVGDPWEENVWERTYKIAVVTVATA